MATVREIERYFDEKVPFSLKMDFDNVGLLCGFPEKEVRKVLLALDVTREVIDEAAELGAELIVTHHPVIFHPLKRVCSDDLEGGRVVAMLQKGLSAICLHTNLDIVEGGVNDALAEALGLAVCGALECGRVAELPGEESMSSFCRRAESALRVSGLRFYDSGKPVKRVALCGGSGGDLVYEAAALGCDTVLTGEIKYNQWLDGKEQGLNLIDADHFCTENVVIPVLDKLLRSAYPELEIIVSGRHAQTLQGI